MKKVCGEFIGYENGKAILALIVGEGLGDNKVIDPSR